MSDQETILFQREDTKFEADALNRLHLSTAVHHHHPTAATSYQTTTEAPESCTTYSNTKKRQLLPPKSFQEPSKRANLQCSCPHATNTAANNNSTNTFLGFTALPLPLPFPSSPSLPLRRTISDPTQFSGHIPNPSLQEGPVINKKEAGSTAILRTTSDPTPVSNLNASNAFTPPCPPPSRKVLESLRLGESPDTMRLKRMKERLREMNQWWNHVMSEEEEDQEDDCENIPKDEPEPEPEPETETETETETEKAQEEAVWVEQNGNCLVLHFKCPCGNGYQVLLNGNNCYYKLTSL